MSGFHFCSGTIFKNTFGSYETPRDIKVKKFFFLKTLKSYRSTERSVIPENKQVLSHDMLKFLWIQGVIK